MGFFVASRQTVELDVFLRSFVVYAQIARHHVRVAMLYAIETGLVAPDAPPLDLKLAIGQREAAS